MIQKPTSLFIAFHINGSDRLSMIPAGDLISTDRQAQLKRITEFLGEEVHVHSVRPVTAVDLDEAFKRVLTAPVIHL